MLDFRLKSTSLFKSLSAKALTKNVQFSFPILDGHLEFKIPAFRSTQDSFHTSKHESHLNFSAPRRRDRSRNSSPDDQDGRNRSPDHPRLSLFPIRTGNEVTGSFREASSTTTSSQVTPSRRRGKQSTSKATQSRNRGRQSRRQTGGNDPETERSANGAGRSALHPMQQANLSETDVEIARRLQEQLDMEDRQELNQKYEAMKKALIKVGKEVEDLLPTIKALEDENANPATNDSLPYFARSSYPNRESLKQLQKARTDWDSSSKALHDIVNSRPPHHERNSAEHNAYNVRHNTARIEAYKAWNTLKENASVEQIMEGQLTSKRKALENAISELYKTIPDIDSKLARFYKLTESANKAEAKYMGQQKILMKRADMKENAKHLKETQAAFIKFTARVANRALEADQQRMDRALDGLRPLDNANNRPIFKKNDSEDKKIEKLKSQIEKFKDWKPPRLSGSKQLKDRIGENQKTFLKLSTEINDLVSGMNLPDFDSKELEPLKELRTCLIAGVSKIEDGPDYYKTVNEAWFALQDPTRSLEQISYNEDKHIIEIFYNDTTRTQIMDPPVPRLRINAENQRNAYIYRWSWLYWLKRPEILGDYLPTTFHPNAINREESINEENGQKNAVCQVWKADPEEA